MSGKSPWKYKEILLGIAFYNLVTFFEESLLKNNLESCLF